MKEINRKECSFYICSLFYQGNFFFTRSIQQTTPYVSVDKTWGHMPNSIAISDKREQYLAQCLLNKIRVLLAMKSMQGWLAGRQQWPYPSSNMSAKMEVYRKCCESIKKCYTLPRITREYFRECDI